MAEQFLTRRERREAERRAAEAEFDATHGDSTAGVAEAPGGTSVPPSAARPLVSHEEAKPTAPAEPPAAMPGDTPTGRAEFVSPAASAAPAAPADPAEPAVPAEEPVFASRAERRRYLREHGLAEDPSDVATGDLPPVNTLRPIATHADAPVDPAPRTAQAPGPKGKAATPAAAPVDKSAEPAQPAKPSGRDEPATPKQQAKPKPSVKPAEPTASKPAQPVIPPESKAVPAAAAKAPVDEPKAETSKPAPKPAAQPEPARPEPDPAPTPKPAPKPAQQAPDPVEKASEPEASAAGRPSEEPAPKKAQTAAGMDRGPRKPRRAPVVAPPSSQAIKVVSGDEKNTAGEPGELRDLGSHPQTMPIETVRAAQHSDDEAEITDEVWPEDAPAGSIPGTPMRASDVTHADGEVLMGEHFSWTPFIFLGAALVVAIALIVVALTMLF
ncbi:hypothetical protein NQ038_03010 [Brevibacterium sp. 50QC2O2]|uniref:hypothetical protein n=1 Tax=Brevibacterium TaxID=1696 RepID=UPI00211CDF73|nr:MULTISPECIES: hypothetical protein [unclassified Brevibacterium]MCQ9384854.1 hypothetical protein [Brevibacterium sp. 68QC2CO]MCQ9387619.1 hypothetical protein [Brevibacterium sp. 50QC2O2]